MSRPADMNTEALREMKSKRPLFALVISLFTALTYGSPQAQEQGLKASTVGDISYVSGGVGASEQEALEQVKSKYNLWLSFAVSGSGAFLAEVPVTIADKSGQAVLEAVSAGPYFYAQIPVGNYRISAQRENQVETHSVSVPATGGVSVDFRWATE